MTPEVWERIAQIRRGEIPAGYRRGNAGIAPENWKSIFLRDIASYANVRAKGERKAYVSTENMASNYGTVSFSEKNELVDGVAYRKGNVLIGNIRPYLKKVWLADRDGVCSADVLVLQSHGIEPLYFYHLIARDEFFRYVMGNAKGSKMPRGDKNHIMNMPLRIPASETEQTLIGDILSAQDKIIELQERLVTEKRSQKKWLMQRLLTGKQRLPGFHGEWKEYPFECVFTSVSSRNHQIQSPEYLPKGMIPVVDQGKKKIAAYSNDFSKKISVSKDGLIVFGDHTREVKFIDFDFIVGADGTQLLQARKNIAITAYMYYCLSGKTITDDGYSRHFKYVKEFSYKIPPIDEQNAIADILSAADREIDLLQRKLEQEKRKKKALSQLLLTGIVRV